MKRRRDLRLRFRWLLLPALVGGAIGAAPVARASESLWNMEGIGRPLNGYDHAARGAGSTAIAVDDPYGMSFTNPASIANARLTQGYFGFLNQNRWISVDGADGSDRRFDAGLTAGRVLLTGPGPLRFALGYTDLTDNTYRVRFQVNSGRDDEFRRTLKGLGGVGEISLAVAGRFAHDRIAGGVHLGLANGTLKDEVEDHFSGGDYLDTRNTLRTRVETGKTVALGVQGRVSSALSVGACWRSASSVDLKGLWKTAAGAEWQQTAGFDLPTSVGLGVAWKASRRLRLAADWNRTGWGEPEFTLRSTGEKAETDGFGALEDTDRFGVGVTLAPSAPEIPVSVLRRAVWRAGFTWGQLPVLPRGRDGAAGEQITEWAFTGGLGLPIQVDRGYLDFFVETGRTGNQDALGLRESFVRVGIGAAFGKFAQKF